MLGIIRFFNDLRKLNQPAAVQKKSFGGYPRRNKEFRDSNAREGIHLLNRFSNMEDSTADPT